MIQFITMNAQAIYILVNGCPYPGPLTVSGEGEGTRIYLVCRSATWEPRYATCK